MKGQKGWEKKYGEIYTEIDILEIKRYRNELITNKIETYTERDIEIDSERCVESKRYR